MDVHLSAQARVELFGIGKWIERESPTQAAIFVEDLYAACISLGEGPKAFPLLPRHPESGIRRRPYRNYLIFYTVLKRLHVIHSARNYEDILFPTKLHSLPPR
jgi:toxin ParE1/3/4